MVGPVLAEQSRAWCGGGPRLSQRPLSLEAPCDAADSERALGVLWAENMTAAKMTVSATEALSPGLFSKAQKEKKTQHC